MLRYGLVVRYHAVGSHLRPQLLLHARLCKLSLTSCDLSRCQRRLLLSGSGTIWLHAACCHANPYRRTSWASHHRATLALALTSLGTTHHRLTSAAWTDHDLLLGSALTSCHALLRTRLLLRLALRSAYWHLLARLAHGRSHRTSNNVLLTSWSCGHHLLPAWTQLHTRPSSSSVHLLGLLLRSTATHWTGHKTRWHAPLLLRHNSHHARSHLHLHVLARTLWLLRRGSMTHRAHGVTTASWHVHHLLLLALTLRRCHRSSIHHLARLAGHHAMRTTCTHWRVTVTPSGHVTRVHWCPASLACLLHHVTARSHLIGC